MKSLKYIILFVIVFLTSVASAQDSLLTALSYYPLSNGDYWEYRYYVDDFLSDPPQFSEWFYSIQVMGDTILPNSVKYKILERRSIPEDYQPTHYFERIDSSTANVYRYDKDSYLTNHEILIDSLMSDLGDTSIATRFGVGLTNPQTVCINVDTISVLGEETIVKSFYDYSLMHMPFYDLAMGFGYVYDSHCDISCFVNELLYASINGVEFGEKVSYIKYDEIISLGNYHLYQNYPNPFNPNTTFSFYVPVKSRVNISLYDITGRIVEEIVSEIYSKGYHTIEFNATNLASGLYLYILNSNTTSISRKLILLK